MIGAKRQRAIIPIMDAAGKTTMSVGARRTVDLRFVELTDKVRKNRPGDDIDLLRRAYDFAAEQHKTQIPPFRRTLPLASRSKWRTSSRT